MIVSEGFWNCCADKPAAAILMTNASGATVAVEACVSCACTYNRISRRYATELHANRTDRARSVAGMVALVNSAGLGVNA